MCYFIQLKKKKKLLFCLKVCFPFCLLHWNLFMLIFFLSGLYVLSTEMLTFTDMLSLALEFQTKEEWKYRSNSCFTSITAHLYKLWLRETWPQECGNISQWEICTHNLHPFLKLTGGSLYYKWHRCNKPKTLNMHWNCH